MYSQQSRQEMADDHHARAMRAKMGRGEGVVANLSAYHPDFGMSLAKHEANKRGRAAGTVAFVPKEQLRARRSGMLGGMFRGR